MPKYDGVYARGRDVLGEPFPQVISFFEAMEGQKVVLDPGAGQN